MITIVYQAWWDVAHWICWWSRLRCGNEKCQEQHLHRWMMETTVRGGWSTTNLEAQGVKSSVLNMMHMVVWPGLYTSSWQLDALAQMTGQGRRCQCDPGTEKRVWAEMDPLCIGVLVRQVLPEAAWLIHSWLSPEQGACFKGPHTKIGR